MLPQDKNIMKIKLSLKVIVAFLFVNVTLAQTEKQRAEIKSTYNKDVLNTISQNIKTYTIQQKAAVKRLVSEGHSEFIYHKDGTFDQLTGISADDSPMYLSLYNDDSADAVNASALYTGGSLGLDINGEGMVAYVWDGGKVRTSHQEFDGTNKVEQVDHEGPVTPADLNGNSSHAVHVAGTLAARGGVPAARGMAHKAIIKSYDWIDEFNEINNASSGGALITNHSYGLTTSSAPDWKFGAYSDVAYFIDQMTDAYEFYLFVTAAGNDGNTAYNGSPLESNSAYDKLTWRAVTKNSLSVANGYNPIMDANGNITSFSRNSTSSEGPTDDLRIKPDITGIGTDVYSCGVTADNTYRTTSGTSMASPNVSGTLLLLQQYYNQVEGNFMRGYTLRGLALHTAVDDNTQVGPDAQVGWGLLDAKTAANVITDKGNTSRITESIIQNGQQLSINYDSDGSEPFRVSISWFDVGSQTVSYDGASGPNTGPKVLINDLDIRVTKDGVTYYPWRLTAVDANANDGDNDRDNFERIDIENPTSGTYTVTISHKGTLPAAGETFSLIVTGVESNNLSTSSFTQNDISVFPNPTNNDLNVKLNSNSSESISVSLIDVLGRNVFSKKYKTNGSVFSQKIPMSNLKSGMYFLQITQNGNTITKKIMKK